MAIPTTGFAPSVERHGSGRLVADNIRPDGQICFNLVEWTTAKPNIAFLAKVKERILTPGRPEEAHIFKINEIINDSHRTSIVYDLGEEPIDLYSVLLMVPKPSSDDRRQLAYIVASQVRSLHVHFQLCHPAMRTKTFGFLPTPQITNGYPVDLAKPYILDLTRCPPSRQLPLIFSCTLSTRRRQRQRQSMEGGTTKPGP